MKSKFKQATDRRVAIFVAEGLEEIEALTQVDILFRAGIPCDLVSITDDLEIKSSHDVRVTCNRSITDPKFNFDDYDVLFLPGGIPGALNLAACEPLLAAVRRFVQEGSGQGTEGKQVAAICAAPAILAKRGLLKGRRATANPGYQSDLFECGAIVMADSAVVEDDNIVTSQGMGTAIDMGLCLVRRLRGEDAVKHVRSGIVWLH
jgi:4-methyl-5(b-hydroxyethyl)-thiazole monophosphate biosynthesis